MHISAGLRITSDQLEPDQITSLLRLEPTSKWKKGDLIETSKGKAGAASGCWGLYSEVIESDDVADHLHWLLVQFAPLGAHLHKLKTDGCWIDICCNLSSSNSIEGFILPPKVLAAAGELGFEIDFTVVLSEALSEAEREAAEKAKALIRRQEALKRAGLPGCLADSITAQENEIYIVEGYSAGGSAKVARDRNFQAVLPIGQKIPDPDREAIGKLFQHEDLQTIFRALGMTLPTNAHTPNPDLSKLRYQKVIILTDEDTQGIRIRRRLVEVFYRYANQLISSGVLYVALPPLFVIGTIQKNEYCYSKNHLEERLQELGVKESSVHHFRGLGEMQASELWESCMDPAKRILQQVTLTNITDFLKK